MKFFVVTLGLLALTFSTACESEHHHRHHDRYQGGVYSGPEYPMYGHDAYRPAYPPNYHGYPDYWSRPDWR